MSRQQPYLLSSNAHTTGKHELTHSKRTGLGWFLNWSVIQLLPDQPSSRISCERHPDRYRPTQVRTLQRHIQQWRVLHGPDREVMFAQEHLRGERGQSDFTHM